MSFVLRALLASAKVRRRLARSKSADRPALIARLVAGKSFLDMGGMWSVHGEYSFLAERAGASRVVLCDGMLPTEEFERRRTESGSRVEYARGDLHDPGTVEQLGQFDVVWCTGVLYHSPDPYRLIEHLRQLTIETLVLGTAVIPELPGFEGGALFYPALSESSRRAFAWLHGPTSGGMLGPVAPIDRTPLMGYSNWWWALTPSAVLGMLDLARFKTVERVQTTPLLLDVVAETVPGEPVAPPIDAAREWRGAATSSR